MCANAFIQAEMPDISDGKEWERMKITGVLVDMPVQLSPEIKMEGQQHLEKDRFNQYKRSKSSTQGAVQMLS